ncbi:lipopolysaccharide biosynthesis protein [Tellurirhabdus rosea]|uniref:lipopolysaccharide biosynthesis protein n=1 Tax=Tellurirhabdus rosea TaxID=2674997 RepID=UPI00224FDFF9|nr:lipopolysaccharide biosynthesis protein [Tellurirhabdus rosea]
MKKLPLESIRKLLNSNVVLSLLGNGVATVLSLLSFTLQARWMSTSALGGFIYLYTIYTLFDTVRTGLMYNALLQQGAASTSEKGFRRWEGAVWQINLLFSAVGVLLGTAVVLVGQTWIPIDGKALGWLALSIMVSIPGNISSWMLLVRSRFRPMQIQKVLYPAIMIVILAGMQFRGGITQEKMMLANLGLTAGLSLLSIGAGWCLPQSVTRGTLQERKHFYRYGKFSIGALLGSSLLRNSDIYLLRFFVGPEAIALYSIPLRLIQIIEVPLRSVVSASIPAIVKAFHHDTPRVLSRMVAREAGGLVICLVPVAALGFLLADYLVVWLAGAQYKAAAPLVRIFMVYSLLLPLDRYLGVTLDAIGKPKANLIKMFGMLAINVVGDCLALWLFPTPEAVAAVSIVTFGSGILIGLHHANQHKVPLTLRSIGAQGLFFVRELLDKGLKKEKAEPASSALTK